MLKIAIIGCGSISHVHAQIINQSNNAQLISCCDENFQKAMIFSEKYEIKCFQNISDLFEYQKPDVVHICTSHYSHAPLTAFAIKNGANVLLEKPASINSYDIDILKKIILNSDKQVAVCFQNRYNDSSVFVKSKINEMGNPIGIRGLLNWFRDDNYYTSTYWKGGTNTEGASVILNQAIHTLDLMQWFFGKPINICGSVSNKGHVNVINTEDTADCIMSFENGAKGIFYASICNSYDAPIEIEMNFEKGIILIKGDNVSVNYNDGTSFSPEFKTQNAVDGKNYWGASHKTLIADFYNHLLENKKFELNFDEGTKVLDTCFKIISGVYTA